MVYTSSVNVGSTPINVLNSIVAQLARAAWLTSKVVGSNPIGTANDRDCEN